MTSAIRVTTEAFPTKEDNIDSARRDRAHLLAGVLWAAGARPGDPISERSWGEAETAAGLDHTSECTRLYAVELLKCRAEGREPVFIAGRHYDLPERYRDKAVWVDRTIREFQAGHPMFDAEQVAIMVCVVIATRTNASSGPPSTPATRYPSEVEQDVLSALLNMKVKASVATAAVKRAVAEAGAENFDKLFPLAIRYVNPGRS